MFNRNPGLDGLYTVVGRVVEGMEHIDQIKKAPRTVESGMVEDPDQILTLDVMADLR